MSDNPFVGTWTYRSLLNDPDVNTDFDTEAEFQLPAVQFVAGVPGAQGFGNVTLDVTVRERATGYEEKTTHLLTVAATPVNLLVIPDSNVFKPSLPLSFLVVTETPDGSPTDQDVQVNLSFMGKDFDTVEQETLSVRTVNGKALFEITPPRDATSLNLEASSDGASTSLTLQAGYSPSGNFIHVEQTTDGPVSVGEAVSFHVASTRQASNFYYEVLSRGTVIFTDVSRSPDISFTATQLMAPSSRLLVYQILPNNEVAADYLPFSVEASYPHEVEVSFSSEQVAPGESVSVNVQAQGEARVGLAAVDRSVFILAENRLNLKQVFDELERLYLKPQVELHEARFQQTIATRGASETFDDAGVVVLTNKTVPAGEKYENERFLFRAEMADGAVMMAVPQAAPGLPGLTAAVSAPEGLAEVQRVRQFFPETWLWQDVTTGADGRAALTVEAPDSITTWMLRAVGMSKELGLGVAEAQLTVFQPFFLQADLPFSAIRGEEFPVKIALYNYLDSPQEIFVEIEEADWFDLLDEPLKSVTVAPNDIGGIEFRIRPTALGSNPLRITARSLEAADAIIRDLLIEPEGVQREVLENHVLSQGQTRALDLNPPGNIVEGSARAYVAITGNYLTQTIEGLESLLQMPFGCGEQNMILFAPNVFIARYLKETGQLKPEIMAKAEHLMITGYQREMTYRHSDGSFSAFGEQDETGSLWLTAFVLKTFSQAKSIMYIDEAVLSEAASWIASHQKGDGSFEPVGFLHHQELLGGLQGKTALTAYVALALMEAGENTAAGRAVQYLEGQLPTIDDAYGMAITAYALALADSPRARDAYDRLMGMAKEDDGSLYWGHDSPIVPLPRPDLGRFVQPNHSAAIETTGYATLALVENRDPINAARASRWLASQRNAFGGFGSTQDTVVALQALTSYAADARSDVDMTVTLVSGDWRREVRVNSQNADVLQTIQTPVGGELQVTTSGRGDVVLQSVLRYNMPETDETAREIFQILVDYGTDTVDVNDLITVSVNVKFTPPEPIEAGMVVLDIAVPTGFAPVPESIASLVEDMPKLKRFDVAGRKVILYIEDMMPNESLSFDFQAIAQYPVRAKESVSQAYSYYRPEWKGETLAGAIAVTD
ncbi:MAG: alpha-2-macroglobulin [Chloroflexi bacterium]|nr:alpha-2-macroglobulin [Chloroflexota bacterium]